MAKTSIMLGNTKVVLTCKRVFLIKLLIQMVYFSVKSLHVIVVLLALFNNSFYSLLLHATIGSLTCWKMRACGVQSSV